MVFQDGGGAEPEIKINKKVAAVLGLKKNHIKKLVTSFVREEAEASSDG